MTTVHAFRSLLVASVGVFLLFSATPGDARGWFGTETAESTVSVSQLPREGQQTYRRIYSGGPFPYEKDGAYFGNRERLLPIEKRGYYREYTVKTRGIRSRGARRIVCGGHVPTRPVACYYTDRHYSEFKRIIDP
jgi:ribonuclease T1